MRALAAVAAVLCYYAILETTNDLKVAHGNIARFWADCQRPVYCRNQSDLADKSGFMAGIKNREITYTANEERANPRRIGIKFRCPPICYSLYGFGSDADSVLKPGVLSREKIYSQNHERSIAEPRRKVSLQFNAIGTKKAMYFDIDKYIQGGALPQVLKVKLKNKISASVAPSQRTRQTNFDRNPRPLFRNHGVSAEFVGFDGRASGDFGLICRLDGLVDAFLDEFGLSVAYAGQDDRINSYSNSGQGGNRTGILINESEEPMNEVITDDIFTGILIIAGAYAWLKWCERERKKDEQKQKNRV